tara:strand:- start:376 stop:1194 length:819 start_codon:yes stop_codon:yes gene_type:complete
MKALFKSILELFTFILIKITSSFNAGRYFNDLILNNISKNKIEIVHGELKLIFYTPNRLCYWRAKTFLSKEPETIDWIDEFKENEIFWDIGSNIGLYSCYAASKKINVISFEPSVFNLEILAKNIFKNRLENKITIVPLALSNTTGIKNFNMSSTEQGGAMSSLAEKLFNQDGIEIKKIFNYNLLSIEPKTICSLMNFKSPHHIKIDVDGIEHLIVSSLDGILHNTKSILVEVDQKFMNNLKSIEKFLMNNNFRLKVAKKENENQFNQLWYR